MDLWQLDRIDCVAWTHVHRLSEHVQGALAAGWTLAQMCEQTIDDRWIANKPSWSAYRDVPVSFSLVWRDRER